MPAHWDVRLPYVKTRDRKRVLQSVYQFRILMFMCSLGVVEKYRGMAPFAGFINEPPGQKSPQVIGPRKDSWGPFKVPLALEPLKPREPPHQPPSPRRWHSPLSFLSLSSSKPSRLQKREAPSNSGSLSWILPGAWVGDPLVLP